MAFTQKIIQVSFSSGSGAFSPMQTSGLRTSVHAVLLSGNSSMGSCDILIYGMPLSEQNQLSTLGWRDQKPNADSVSVFAGDSNGMSNVFTGTIWAAYSDYQGGPNVPFHIVSLSGTREAGLNIKPTSINSKSADVSQVMQQLAGQMGLQFEDGGVTGNTIAYPYLWGSAYNQAKQLAKHANIMMTIDRGTLAIWPSDGSRSAQATVSPTTGLVGYPAWSSEGIRLKMLYSPDLAIGGKITVENSSITPANNTWTITKIEHSLQAFTPQGEWFSNVQGWTPKAGQTTPGLASG